MEFIWGMVIAFVVSVITSVIYHHRTAEGTLKIDRSNPEKDIYRLYIDDLDTIAKKKRIVLDIEADADLSHE